MRSRTSLTPALTPVLAAAAAAAVGAPATPAHAAEAGTLPDLAVRSDCGDSAHDLGKTFHLHGPLPVDHAGCASTDGQYLRVGPDA